MAAWHPFADEALGALAAAGIDRAVALPLYPHESRATTGSSLNQLEGRARATDGGIEIAAIERYPDADGYVRAVVERVEEAIATLPAEHAATRAGPLLGARAARGVHQAAAIPISTTSASPSRR